MMTELLKAFLIGICASAPIGPTAILVLQRTLSCGPKTGFCTALGATVVDTTYSAVALVAISFIEGFVMSHQHPIMIAGGLVVTAIGFGMVFRKLDFDAGESVRVGNTLQAMGCAFANPAAIATMLALVAVFRIDTLIAPIWLLVPCVALGSVFYWSLFTTLFSRLRRAFRPETLKIFNTIAGLIVILLGSILAVKGIFNL